MAERITRIEASERLLALDPDRDSDNCLVLEGYTYEDILDALYPEPPGTWDEND